MKVCNNNAFLVSVNAGKYVLLMQIRNRKRQQLFLLTDGSISWTLTSVNMHRQCAYECGILLFTVLFISLEAMQ